MRLVFACAECESRYLPPEGLRYEALDLEASPVWCSLCQARHAERGIHASPEQEAAALALARRYATARAADEPARSDVRPSRPAVTRRAPKPGGRRTKLA